MNKRTRGKETRKEVWKTVLETIKDRLPKGAEGIATELISQPVPIRAIRLLGELVGIARLPRKEGPSTGKEGPSTGKQDLGQGEPGKIGQLQKEYGNLLDTYQGMFAFVADLIDRVKAHEFTLEQLTDLGYLLREAENLADELRKELKARKNLIGMVICKQASDLALSTGRMDLTVRGTLAMGLPEVKQSPKPPKRGSPEYYELCKYFGISQEVIGTEVVQFHFKRLQQYLVDLAGEGKNPPPGITKTYPVFETVFRKHR